MFLISATLINIDKKPSPILQGLLHADSTNDKLNAFSIWVLLWQVEVFFKARANGQLTIATLDDSTRAVEAKLLISKTTFTL